MTILAIVALIVVGFSLSRILMLWKVKKIFTRYQRILTYANVTEDKLKEIIAQLNIVEELFNMKKK